MRKFQFQEMEQAESEKALPGHQGSYKGGYAELEDGKDSKEEKIFLLGEDGQDCSPFKTTASASQTQGIKN